MIKNCQCISGNKDLTVATPRTVHLFRTVTKIDKHEAKGKLRSLRHTLGSAGAWRGSCQRKGQWSLKRPGRNGTVAAALSPTFPWPSLQHGTSHFLSAFRALWALLLLFVKSLGTDHADGCRIQTQPWLGAPRREGNPRKGRDWGWNRGAGQCALCLLSKGYHQLNLASGFQLEKGAGFRLHWASRGPRSPCPCTC